MRRPPMIRGFFGLPGEIVIDNFAGGGGASTGIEAALGRPVDIAINHDKAAIAMHRANHPETKHYQEDIWAVDPREAAAGRPVGLLWASPDCFPAGTMILTREGHRPIEQVAIGDEVLTHQGRWRRVTSTMGTVKPLIVLRGHGHPGLAVSAEHPFLARRRRDVWNSERHGYTRTLDPAAWVEADRLGPGWYWASPTRFPLEEPPAVPVYGNRLTTITAELLWLAGRYVADGWTRLTNTRAELVITCGKHEVEGLRPLLDAWKREGARAGSDEMAWHERHTGTAYQFTTGHRGLVEWLREHFGHGAAEKRIPGWSLGMARELRQALLDGYLSGDGWRGKTTGSDLVEAQTASKALAFGLKALASSLGNTVTVYVGPNSNTIQGRAVNALPAWKVKWRTDLDPRHRQTWREDGLEWAPVREQLDNGETAEVFNLSVEEDESYIADGIVVHNCTHFSRAKGTQPRKKEIRALAHVVIRWAETVRPRVILLENVEEFQTWGPLGEDGRPDPKQLGADFRAWLAKLVDLGYQVEFRSLIAADYGSPTTRKRLFLVARRDGGPLAFPEATHGRGRPQPWRPAAEVIDWSLPCPSIFDRKKPLAEATMKRIASGVRRFVLEAADPFIIPVTHQGGARVHDIREPVRTVTAAHRGELALVNPFLVRHGHYSTITGAGLHEGCGAGTFRGQQLDVPLGTVCATNDKHLVAPVVVKHYGGVVGHGVERPIGTVTAKDHHSIAAAFLTKFYGTSTGSGVQLPLPTVTAGGHRGGGHLAEVRAFLLKYYSGGEKAKEAQQQSLFAPLHTVTTKARFGLVTVHGEQYEIVDIGMRMLQPHELFAAQGFPEQYDITCESTMGRRLTKTEQTALAGNSVCPDVARALVAANIGERRAAA